MCALIGSQKLLNANQAIYFNKLSFQSINENAKNALKLYR